MQLYSCIVVLGGDFTPQSAKSDHVCPIFNMQAHRKIYQRLHILFIFTFWAVLVEIATNLV